MMFTRRNLMAGTAGVALLAAAAYEGRRLLRKRYAPSPYDDLLAMLDDRDADAQLGEAVLAGNDDFDARSVADGLRTRLVRRSLADAAIQDALAGRLVEANGWVMPETLGLLCALAAKNNG